MSFKEFVSSKIMPIPKILVDRINLKPISEHDTISLFGSARSGSTWIMELLTNLQGYKTVFEPFHRQWYPEFNKMGYSPRPYVKINDQDLLMKGYIQKIINGKIKSQNPRFGPQSIIDRMNADKVIIKYIRGNRLLPWYIKNIQESKVNILLVRHPMATIHSQIVAGEKGDFKVRATSVRAEIIKKEILEIEEINPIKKHLIDNIFSYNDYELFTITYGLNQYIPLLYSDNLDIIFYEDIFNNGIKNIQNILKKHSIQLEDIPNETISAPSSTTSTSFKNEVNKSKQLSKWKNSSNLMSHEDEIKNILELFDISFEENSYTILNKEFTFDT